MIATVLLVENVMIRGERIISGEHFIRHHQGLALDGIVCAHGVIDKVAALIQIVFQNKLLNTPLARNVRIVEVRGSNPLCSITKET